MSLSISRLLALSAALSFGGCSFPLGRALSLSSSETEPVSVPAPSEERGAPVVIASAADDPTVVFVGKTFVGQKVQAFRRALTALNATVRQRVGSVRSLRQRIMADSRVYHRGVAAINVRLQAGSTPANPLLRQRWREARRQLDRIDGDILDMRQLSARIAADAGEAAYLLDSVNSAFSLPGAVDEDHRQLATLQDEIRRTDVSIERLASDLNETISRQRNYVFHERSILNELALAIKEGQLFDLGALQSRVALPLSAAVLNNGPPDANVQTTTRMPLVVVRFDRPNVAYEQALHQAVSQALKRRPNARFELVAVSPGSRATLAADHASRNARRVLRSLIALGIPAAHIRLSALTDADASSEEVRLYVY